MDIPDGENIFCENIWKESFIGVKRLCEYKLSSCPDEIDDVISEVYLAFISTVHNNKIPENPKAWLYGEANNLIKKKYSQINKQKDMSISMSSPEIDEMDTQLIDLCPDVLTKQETPEKQETKKLKKINTKKVLLIAAVVVILLALAIPVAAEIPAIESQGGIFKVLENYISVNLTGGKEYNLSMELQTYEIPNHLIPSRFFENDCVITDVKSAGDNTYRFGFELTDLSIDGYILVSKFTQEWEFGYIYGDIYADVEQMKQLTVNSMEIFVYSSDDEYVDVHYVFDNFSFSILFNNLTIYEAIEIVENF